MLTLSSTGTSIGGCHTNPPPNPEFLPNYVPAGGLPLVLFLRGSALGEEESPAPMLPAGTTPETLTDTPQSPAPRLRSDSIPCEVPRGPSERIPELLLCRGKGVDETRSQFSGRFFQLRCVRASHWEADLQQVYRQHARVGTPELPSSPGFRSSPPPAWW